MLEKSQVTFGIIKGGLFQESDRYPVDYRYLHRRPQGEHNEEAEVKGKRG